MERLLERFSEYLQGNIFPIIFEEIPFTLIDEYKKNSSIQYRDRNYSLEVVMQGLLYQASQEDKSEQNAVMIIAEYYKHLREKYQGLLLEEEKSKQEKRNYEKRGRPPREVPKIQKSKLQEISLNTTSYDRARQRMPEELMELTFKNKCEYFQAQPGDKTWHGHPVFVTDGTTFKTMDTLELRNYFKAEHDKNPPPVPIGRLQGIINLYKGGLVAAAIDTYGSSEGKMLKQLYEHIPKGTLLLGDDLYSSYGHMAYSQNRGIDLIAQGKHFRLDKVIRTFSKTDSLVEWKVNINPAWFDETDQLPAKLIVRKIDVINPAEPAKVITLYTTLLDAAKYPSIDIAVLYFGRWDIEISFRDIKVTMRMEYLRGKTVSMVRKEIFSHLLLYNIIRKKILESKVPDEGTFPPSGNKIQIGLTVDKNKDGYVDKLGRSYFKKGGRRTSNNTVSMQKKKNTRKT
jgi:hypothetical protein